MLSNSLSDHHLSEPVQRLLRKKQRRLVREHEGALFAVAEGARKAVQSCKYQFKWRRWNCSAAVTSSYRKKHGLFGKIVSLRELIHVLLCSLKNQRLIIKLAIKNFRSVFLCYFLDFDTPVWKEGALIKFNISKWIKLRQNEKFDIKTSFSKIYFLFQSLDTFLLTSLLSIVSYLVILSSWF